MDIWQALCDSGPQSNFKNDVNTVEITAQPPSLTFNVTKSEITVSHLVAFIQSEEEHLRLGTVRNPAGSI